jgi:hypothetical protein
MEGMGKAEEEGVGFYFFYFFLFLCETQEEKGTKTFGGKI